MTLNYFYLRVTRLVPKLPIREPENWDWAAIWMPKVWNQAFLRGDVSKTNWLRPGIFMVIIRDTLQYVG